MDSSPLPAQSKEDLTKNPSLVGLLHKGLSWFSRGGIDSGYWTILFLCPQGPLSWLPRDEFTPSA